MGQKSINTFFDSSQYLPRQIPSYEHVNANNHMIQNILKQNFFLLHQNSTINGRLYLLIEEKEQMSRQIDLLRTALANQREIKKRKYSKRRTGLQKKYQCKYEDCRTLNHHIKKNHRVKKEDHQL